MLAFRLHAKLIAGFKAAANGQVWRLHSSTSSGRRELRRANDTPPSEGDDSLSLDDAGVAVARQLADVLEITLYVERRIVAADVDLHQPAARWSPIPFDGPRSISRSGQLLDETIGTFLSGK